MSDQFDLLQEKVNNDHRSCKKKKLKMGNTFQEGSSSLQVAMLAYWEHGGIENSLVPTITNIVSIQGLRHQVDCSDLGESQRTLIVYTIFLKLFIKYISRIELKIWREGKGSDMVIPLLRIQIRLNKRMIFPNLSSVIFFILICHLQGLSYRHRTEWAWTRENRSGFFV